MTGSWSGYLTINEAAGESRLSSRTVRRALRDTRLPLRHYRVGRRVIIARSDLQAWIEAHGSTPATTPTVEKRVLARLSPAARELLDGILCTPAAPHGRKAVNSHA